MQSRGKLKIFLGYAAGVGKTYQMLTEARQMVEEIQEAPTLTLSVAQREIVILDDRMRVRHSVRVDREGDVLGHDLQSSRRVCLSGRGSARKSAGER